MKWILLLIICTPKINKERKYVGRRINYVIIVIEKKERINIIREKL